MEPLSQRKRHTYLIVLTLMFIIGAPLLVGYSFGYRFTKLSWLARTGGVTVTLREPQTTIFIDDVEVRQTNFLQRNYFFQNMNPGEYTIRTNKEGFYTWQSTVPVFPEYVTGTFPLMIPKQIELIPVQQFDTDIDENGEEFNVVSNEYEEFATLFASSTENRIGENVKTFNDITVSKVDNNFIFEWQGNRNNAPYYFCTIIDCESVIEIPVDAREVLAFDFYPGREDALLVLTRAGLVVFNIDSEHHVQIFSLYPSDDLEYIVKGRDVYIKENEMIAKLEI